MIARRLLVIFMILLGSFAVTPIFAQQDEDVRGAFMTTRPKAGATTSSGASTPRPKRRRPKPEATKPVDDKKSGDQKPDVTKNDKQGPTKLNAPRIGLGLTLFMRDSNGMAVRTDPTREFQKGDHVRFLIETSADGFLYVFNTTDGGAPVMIYPDPEVDEAGNYFQSHVPFEIPSSLGAEERLRWFTFDDRAGAEKLYFVLTREPLSAAPIEDDLITFCRDNAGKCPWRPSDELWARIQKEASEPVQIAKAKTMGSKQTESELLAATRGIGLNRDDPEPSLIMLTKSTTKDMLVAIVDLVHKPSATGR